MKKITWIPLIFFIIYIIVFTIALGPAFLPLLIAALSAYWTLPLIRKLEAWGISRRLAMTVVAFLSLFSIILIAILLLPKLLAHAQAFAQEFPQNLALAVDAMESKARAWGLEWEWSKDTILPFLQEHFGNIMGKTLTGLKVLLSLTFENLSGLIFGLIHLFLIPLFYFYILQDLEKYQRKFWSMIPPRHHKGLRQISRLMNNIIAAYFRGQFAIACFLAIFYGFCLEVSGLRFGLLIGLLTGLLCFIPYVGTAVGLCASAIMLVSQSASFGQIVAVLVIFIVAQVLEGFYLTPKWVGDRLGLSEFATLLALMAGAQIAGVTGMMVAVPITAFVKTTFQQWIQSYQRSKYYLAEGSS